MSPTTILLIIGLYFLTLLAIAQFTSHKAGNTAFFNAGRQSPWYLVAFGMIGASLSGVTFISVPGWVEASQFSYFQMVLGYTVGYAIIGLVLLPLYYKLQLTSIYTYLESRFGPRSYKTGASFFLLSRIVGASFRLYLVAVVLQSLVFDAWGIPYWFTVIITILLIWLYTFKGGIQTIVWTDSLQTLCMLTAVGMAVYFVSMEMNLTGANLFAFVSESSYSKIFFWNDWKSGSHFINQFVSGAFIAVVMTGLDQDMMQKNLSCKSLKDAKKNMFWFTIVLTVVNLVFLILGLLLTEFAALESIDAVRDQLFPTIAVQSGLPKVLGVCF